MYVFSSYSIRFDVDNEANKEFAAWLAEELGVDVKADSVASVEEDSRHNHVEDLWDWLEPYVSSHPGVVCVVEGYIDAASSAGEYEDFRLVIKDGSMAAYRTGWYAEYAKEDYIDYDDFCEYHMNSDGTPVCSEEEFDSFSGDFFKMVGFEKVTVYEDVPLVGPIMNRDEL